MPRSPSRPGMREVLRGTEEGMVGGVAADKGGGIAAASAMTASVCSPDRGAGPRTALGVDENSRSDPA